MAEPSVAGLRRGFKTELDPNNIQRTALLKHAGAARWAYNWGLARKIEAYRATGKSPSAIDLHKELNRLKNVPQEGGGVPWMYEVSKCAPQEALRNLDRAYENFFRRCKGKAKRKGFPRFKSRKRGIGSFRLTGVIHVSDGTVQLPRIGKVRLKERGYLPLGLVATATVSETAGRWFVSVQAEASRPLATTSTETVGVDLGVSRLATLSTGEIFENPRALKRAERLFRVRSKALSRKVIGSNNRRKAAHRVARIHYRVSCIRKDAIHKVSSAITKRFGTVVVESLNVAGMMRNRRLAKALSDVALGELLHQVKYKCEWRGCKLIEAPLFYPSSKMCSACGHVLDELPLSVRKWTCPSCGAVHDRDENAAVNLENLAASSVVTACGAGIRLGERLAAKQEPNAIESVGIGG